MTCTTAITDNISLYYSLSIDKNIILRFDAKYLKSSWNVFVKKQTLNFDGKISVILF